MRYTTRVSPIMGPGMEVPSQLLEEENSLYKDVAYQIIMQLVTIQIQILIILHLAEVAALGRSATVSIGNDTGPMHILAAGGQPTFVLFGAASDPALCAPRGENVRCLISRDHGPIENLSAGQVWAAMQPAVGLA